MNKKSVKKIEYGDFQTPRELARQVCIMFKNQKMLPKSVIEPTCGIGSFFSEALNNFSSIKIGHAFDIDNEYVKILKKDLAEQVKSKSYKVEVADFFTKDWKEELNKLPEPVLVIGNPPWVTNSQLGQLQSKNLPTKYNFKQLKGLDALTGKSNFDISEWMINHMIDWIQMKRGTVAMLCKTSVARKVLMNAWKHDKKMDVAKMHIIDSKLHFNISADACLLTIQSSSQQRKECEVFESLSSSSPIQTIGLRDSFLVADIPSYEKIKYLTDSDHYYKWRTGIKHDCSKIMELEKIGDGLYLNGLGETHELEDICLFPLLKGSDLANGKIPKKFMLVPQTKIGQETTCLSKTAPKTWHYLNQHGGLLDKRGSSIYKDKPRFSIFGVGDYTFSNWKVAIPALYKKLEFSVIGPCQNKTIVFDDTVNFLPLDNAEEAHELAELLNSRTASKFYRSFIFWDSKRPITVQLLKSLDIDKLQSKTGKVNNYSIKKTSRQLQLTC
jgi:hypothetical protein